jgi:gliding motility-associated-like protein
MIRKFLILSILFFTCFYSYADVKIYVDPASIAAGQNGKVFVKVDGFQKVSSFQLNLTWDVSKLTFSEVGDLSALNLNAIGDFQVPSPGKMRVLWAHPESDEASLANGTTLFSITFSGVCGSESLINIIDDGFFTVQFTDTNGDQIPHTATPGNITVTGNPCGGAQTVLNATTLDAQSGTKTCLSITAGSGFTSITGISADINMSSSCVSFNEVTNFSAGLAGLGAGSFNLTQAANGIVKLNWTSAISTSLAAGAKLFDICYTPNETCCGTTVPLSFTNVTITTQGGGTNNLTSNGGLNIKCGVEPECNPTGLALIGSDHCAMPNESITMDFTVQDFTNILGVQFSIDYDPACMQLEDIILPEPNPFTGLVKGKFQDQLNGCVIVVWDDATGNSVSVPDGTIMFSLKLKVIGTLGSTCSVNLGSKCVPSGVEFVDVDFQVVPVSFCSGDVMIKQCTEELAIVDGIINNFTCAEPCTGSVSFTVTGATNPTITWSQPGLSGMSVTNLCPGSYTVTVTSGGSSISKPYTITGPPVIIITTVSVTPATAGANGAVDINVTGGTGNFTYQWSTNPAQTTQDITNVPTGSYTVTVTDSGNGCKKSYVVSVSDGSGAFDATVIPKKYGEFDISCGDSCDGQLTANPVGGTAPYTYLWSSKNVATQTITDICAGTYSVTITDNTNKTVTKSYTILAPQKLLVDFDIIYPSDDVALDGSISAVPIGGTAPFIYSWTGAVVSSSKELTNIGVGTYAVSVTDLSGCSATSSKVITPGGKGCYSGIGAITPNGDGKNDRLIISCVSTVSNRILIFNRWGEKVFEQSSYKNTWEGVDSKGENLPDGGYYWVLEVKESNGGTEVFKGSVSIIRTLR